MHARTQRSLYSYEENERPIRPMDMQEEHHYVVEKITILSSALFSHPLSLSHSLPAHSASLCICFSWSLSRLSSIKSFLRNRSIGVFVRFYWSKVQPSLFGQRAFHSHRFRLARTTQFPLSRLLWLSAGIDPLARTWLAVANLITGSPHLVAALCIFFSLLRKQVDILASGEFLFFFFFLLFSLFFSPCREQTHLGVLAVFAGLLRLRFLDETLRGTRLLVNGRMRDPGSTYVAIQI